jgi:hypothetical protein
VCGSIATSLVLDRKCFVVERAVDLVEKFDAALV